MDDNLNILGPEHSVIYFNINKQFSNIKKLVITSDIIFGSFESADMKVLFEELSGLDEDGYVERIKNLDNEEAFSVLMKNDLYQKVHEYLSKISNNVMDIQLKDFNFMNSMSNAKFNVVLRCDTFSISRYFVEKGAILSSIRSLMKDYLEFEGNAYRLNRLSNFQIEIFESEDIYKRILLKKEGSSLVLASDFGFPKSSPIDYNASSELYFSLNNSFNFFQNNQSVAIFRDHAKLTEHEINSQEKVLSNDDLVSVNKITKNIDDAVIELYISKKGAIRITHISLLENSITHGNEGGFLINKSGKNYNKISIVTLRDNLEDELSNPKYLLIRNANEVKELLEGISMLRHVDGLIFNENFYMPFLDKVGCVLDIDILYYKDLLKKALEVDVDFNQVKIEQESPKSSDSFNPFSSIINEGNKEKDAFLERLKNLDLNTPAPRRTEEYENVSQKAQQIISSPNSSQNTNGGATMNFNNDSGKKSAIGMLAEAVLRNDAKPIQEEVPKQAQMPQENMQEQSSQSSGFNQQSNQGSYGQNQAYEQQYQQPMASQNNMSQFGLGSVSMSQPQSRPEVSTPSIDVHCSSQVPDIGINNTSVVKEESPKVEIKSEVDVKKYEQVLATKLITSPNVNSGCYFADPNNISSVGDGDIFFLTASKENISNPHLNYVLPINLFEESLKEHYFLINNANDFFLIDEKKSGSKFFVNLSYIDGSIKKTFLDKCIELSSNVCIILNKQDLDLVEDKIERITGVFVKDIHSEDDMTEVKYRLLAFEKNFLMKRF